MANIPDQIGGYQVLRKLAEGGMAELFLARGSEGVVAVKRILPQYAAAPEFVSMFEDEARIAARLDHPNIARALALGSGERPFFALEYVRGRDCLQLLRTAGKQGGVPLAQALTIIRGAAAGLHYAHEQRDAAGVPLGIVHRDVSPANVLVSFDGQVKVVDFGVAKADKRSCETRIGVVKGKLGYMSPEQSQQLPVDRRSDVFGLGILLYELTTATRLYRGKTEYDLLREVATADVAHPETRRPGYPAALAAIVMKALSRDPGDRYPTTAALAADLEAFAVGEGLALSASRLADYLVGLYPGESESTLREASDGDEPATTLWSCQPPAASTRLASPPPAPFEARPALGSVPPLVAPAAPKARLATVYAKPRVASAPALAAPPQLQASPRRVPRPRRRVTTGIVAWAVAVLVMLLPVDRPPAAKSPAHTVVAQPARVVPPQIAATLIQP